MSEPNTDLLRRVGAGLYGRQWQSALAVDLSVTDRTMRRWASGGTIPEGIWPQLLSIIIEREALLAGLRYELRP